MMRLGRVQTIRLAVICSLFMLMISCSDKTNQGSASTPEAESQTSSRQITETQPPPPPAAAATPAPAQTASTPDGDASPCSTLLETACTECHNTTRVCEKLGKKSKSRWQRTLTRMIERGAKLSADDEAVLLDCLDNGVNVLQEACR